MFANTRGGAIGMKLFVRTIAATLWLLYVTAFIGYIEIAVTNRFSGHMMYFYLLK